MTPLLASGDLTDAQMRRDAGEFNQAETTFIQRSTCTEWKLRSFCKRSGGVQGRVQCPGGVALAWGAW